MLPLLELIEIQCAFVFDFNFRPFIGSVLVGPHTIHDFLKNS